MVFAGLDTDAYPGDDVWPWLKANTPVTSAGAYLAPAPDHGRADWMGKRAAMLAGGINPVPIYLARQWTGEGAEPGMVTGAQGAADALNMAALLRGFGAPPGSFGFADRETPNTSPAETAYVVNLARGVQALRFGFGLYCSHLTAAYWRSVLPGVRLWVYRLVDGHGIGSAAALPGPSPDGAALWQFAQDQQFEVAGRTLNVDFNVATTPDPSAP
jgi:hypothetical protein